MCSEFLCRTSVNFPEMIAHLQRQDKVSVNENIIMLIIQNKNINNGYKRSTDKVFY